MPKICIISGDERYRHAIKLDLMRYFDSVSYADVSTMDEHDVAIIDLDSTDIPSDVLTATTNLKICISRRAACLNALPTHESVACLHRPFRDGKLVSLCGGASYAPTPADTASHLPRLSADHRTALLDGKVIKLTEREGEILEILLAANGECVSKSELYSRVFGDEEDGEGVVPVYIHYLRRKLEYDGRRLIYSRRGGGYSIRRDD